MKIVSIPALKTFMEKTDTAQDDLLGMLIDSVSKRVETYLNRQLSKQSRTMYFDAGRTRYFLPAYPIDLSAPFIVKYDGVVYVKDTDYFVWEEDAMVEFYWLPVYYKPKMVEITWTGGFMESPISEVTGSDGSIYRCIQSHTAAPDNKPITGPNYDTFWSKAGITGGAWANGFAYAAHAYLSGAPDDLRLAAMLQCSYAFRRRKETGLKSVSTPDGSKTFETAQTQPTKLLPEVKDMLRSYRKVPTER